MADFNLFKGSVLEAEGGYQNNPTDWRGNTNSLNELVGTNRGISAPQYEDYIGRPPSVNDMRNITKETALTIYETIYWNRLVKANSINSQAVAEQLVDMTINAKSKGVKLMQQTLNDHFNFNLIEDNLIGTKTLAAINSVDEVDLYNAYVGKRQDYYENVKHWDSSLHQTYINGWLKRVQNLYDKHLRFFLNNPITNNPKASGLGLFLAVLFVGAVIRFKN